MKMQWHGLVDEAALEHPGIVINAIQRYLQFDTFAGAIESEAIDVLFTRDELLVLIEKSSTFYHQNRPVLSTMDQNRQEECLRAYLCGFIDAAADDPALWHTKLHDLHRENRALYDKLNTTEQVLALIERFDCADLIASSVALYCKKQVETYTPTELVKWTVQAKSFFDQNRGRLERYSTTEQRQILSDYLNGDTSIAW